MPAPVPPGRAWWVPLGGVLLALVYLPTLTAPFDFIDDGNLVYPAPAGTTLTQHAERYADKVRANVDHLGPFRPVLWAHWELFANTLDADPLLWRAVRLAWCAAAATALLALLRSLHVPPLPAMLAGLGCVANPYRSEIWTSLTLAEGVAMPYCLAALWAARRAAASPRPAAWDALAVASFVAALGCKNTFAALAPALIALRVLPDAGRPTAAACRRALVYLLPLALPAVHFAYFKLNWKPGQYETPGPTLAQLGRELSWLKGCAGLDFLAAGVSLSVAAVWWTRRTPSHDESSRPLLPIHYRPAVVCASLLIAAGVAAYLPLPMMAARYTMPAVWGLDIGLALLLAALLRLPAGWPKAVALTAVAAGLVGLTAANVGRQEKVAARSRLLWDALHHVERAAPPGARLAWVGGGTSAASLNVEEGIHFRWHLLHRGRPDIEVGLVDAAGSPVARVELPPLSGPPDYRVAMGPGAVTFTQDYWLGRKRLTCHVTPVRRPATDTGLSDAEALARLATPAATGGPAVAARR